ncbi:hypothetical protein RRG08_015185, partial [Elysia crispata]
LPPLSSTDEVSDLKTTLSPPSSSPALPPLSSTDDFSDLRTSPRPPTGSPVPSTTRLSTDSSATTPVTNGQTPKRPHDWPVVLTLLALPCLVQFLSSWF